MSAERRAELRAIDMMVEAKTFLDSMWLDFKQQFDPNDLLPYTGPYKRSKEVQRDEESREIVQAFIKFAE